MSTIIDRLKLWADHDKDMHKLLMDAVNEIEMLRQEMNRLRQHNERLLQILYQNQSEIEELIKEAP